MSWLLMATGEAATVTQASSIASTVANLGALGVLSVVAYFLFQDTRTQRAEGAATRAENTKIMNMLCERWNDWEKIRHDDSNKLDETLRTITANCSATQAKQS